MKQPAFIIATAILLLPRAQVAQAASDVLQQALQQVVEADKFIQEKGADPRFWSCNYVDYERERKKKEEELKSRINNPSITKEDAQTVKDRLKEINGKVKTLKLTKPSDFVDSLPFDKIGDLNQLAAALGPANGDQFNTMRLVRYGSQQTRAYVGRNIPALEGFLAKPIDTATGNADFKCSDDVTKLVSELRRRAEALNRTASDAHFGSLVKKMEEGGTGASITYYQKKFTTTFLGSNEYLAAGKCEGLIELVKGIDKSQKDELDAVNRMIAYMKDESQRLTKQADELAALCPRLESSGS